MFSLERRQFIRFVTDIIACGTLIVILCTAVIVVSYDPESYASSLHQKLARLAEAPSPRLVLIGGSGVAVGVDSALIEERTGYHPVNMGIFAAEGLRFMLKTVEPKLHRGDIVLILPEDEVVQQPMYGSGYYLFQIAHSNPEQLSYLLTLHSLTTMGHDFPGWFQQKLEAIYVWYIEPYFYKRVPSLSDRLYNVYNIDAYGDVGSETVGAVHLSVEALRASEDGFVGGTGTNPKTMTFLSSEVGALEAREIEVLIGWPATARSLYEAHQEDTDARAQEFKTLFGERVVGSPQDFLVSDSMFLDSATHLAPDGREKYTKQLIPLLLKHLKAQ